MKTYLKLSLLVCFLGSTAHADPLGPLMTRDLAGIPGKEAVVLKSDPGRDPSRTGTMRMCLYTCWRDRS